RKRDQQLVKQRKELDNYTCQVCDFSLTIEGKSIIECHHLLPLNFGERETKIEDLVCLCPTCHRIAHLRKEPLILTKLSHTYKKYNKQFKSDSARLAFSVWLSLVFTMVKLRVVVACFTP
ncbi:TPA: hypothetical protein JG821_004609, partial [Vibrio parahaemolyticus]|nr:hypothetical protein [Vibrio parahaemolyticus]